jgi:uncharacterized protein (UPF0261 family)
MSIFLIATLDTKGAEAAFVRDLIVAQGESVVLVDGGSLGAPTTAADVQREQVFAAAGASLEAIRKQQDRGQAVALASRGVATLITEAFAAGKLTGVISIGGSAGTTIGTAAMRALPIGVPKVMVSTLASGQVRPYVGDKDIMMLNSVVDIAGINRISRRVLTQSAIAISALSNEYRKSLQSPATTDAPLIAATMFGVTTPCVNIARGILEQAGFEVLVFHATGTGGQAMETLVRDGLIAGVLDITTTELADECVGGVLSAGPSRLTAAGLAGVPQLISVGALDMVNFGTPESVPPKFAARKFYQHNPTVTLMRTTVEENAQLGAEIGRKAQMAIGPTAILLPGHGVSALDAAEKPFDDPMARRALFDSIRSNAGHIEVSEIPYHINDDAFAKAAAAKLLTLIRSRSDALESS